MLIRLSVIERGARGMNELRKERKDARRTNGWRGYLLSSGTHSEISQII
jgi:hypothetical protein